MDGLEVLVDVIASTGERNNVIHVPLGDSGGTTLRQSIVEFASADPAKPSRTLKDAFTIEGISKGSDQRSSSGAPCGFQQAFRFLALELVPRDAG